MPSIMRMRKVYPTVLTPAKSISGYVVYVPGMEINTQGHDLAEAIFMARDAIGACGISYQDRGQQIPAPPQDVQVTKENEILTYVDIDFDEYRKENDTTTVRTTVSLPRNLKLKGEAAGISFSRELQARLREVLHV